MTEEDPQEARKILVLGSNPPTRKVISYLWDAIPAGINVADFDAVILNFYPLDVPATAREINLDTIPSSLQFARLLFSRASQIFVIGKPFFRLGTSPYWSSTWWLPLQPQFLKESGDTIKVKSPEYSSYFDNVKAWHFCFSGWEGIKQPHFSDYMQAAGLRRADSIRPRVYSIAENRYGRAVGFTVSFEAMSERGGHVADSGFVVWLPPTTEIPVDDAIDLILRDRLGIIKEDPAPPWLAEFVMPAEVPIAEQIADLERRVGSLGDDLLQARSDLRQASRFTKMLYETGEEVLEPIVLDALAVLGADVELPEVAGKEDGRLADPSGRLGTLEIKGRSRPLRLGDVRQTHQWVADRIAYEETESKGILIANLNKDETPSERGDVFPLNCVKAAQNFDICLLTTTQLLNAVILYQEEKLKVSEFWDAVFEASGISAFPELR